jgi:hypothetical protein
MSIFTAEGLAEQLQDHIATNSGLSYVVGGNFTLGSSPDPIADFPTIVSADRIRLTLYEDGGSFTRNSRHVYQFREFRLIFRGDYPQDAVNRAWRLIQWFQRSNTHFSLTGFSVRFLDVPSLPQVVFNGEDGTALASAVLRFLAISKG